MLGIAASCWSARALAQQLTAADEREIKAVNERATAAGLDPFRHTSTAHYLGIGNAKSEWVRDALKLCEELADDYLADFRKKGFNVALPKDRMTVIALADPASFADYLGTKPDEAVGGVYDLENNRLTIFDNRARDARGPQLARANTVSLMHEATHQLTFNTNLLDRAADIPLIISEGLGTYGEVHRPKGQSKVGARNDLRLDVFVANRPRGEAAGADKERQKKKPEPVWIPFKKLLTNDDIFANADDGQLAYAEAWMTVHYMLHNVERLPQFRTYLKTLRKSEDAKTRVADAEAAFGDLDVLDKELRTYLTQKRAQIRRP
jgi:Protein of unknown function (DUF1570)